MTEVTATEDAAVVKDPPWLRGLYWVGFPLLGAGLGWLVKELAVWVAGMSWAPWQGLFKAVASIPEPGATWGALGVGVLAGLVLGFLAWQESLVVRIGAGSVELKRGDTVREFAAPAVKGVFVDGGQLVLLGPQGRELAREKSDLDGAELRRVFEERGFDWLDADPFAGRFERWLDEDPRLPAAAHALLRARARAVDKGRADDARELREELARLGVVVRDERKRQFWRPAGVQDGVQDGGS